MFQQDSPRNLLVSVEGSMGIGKSTLAGRLSELLGYELVEEPLGGDIKQVRELFYSDMKRWAFPFQMKIFQKRFRHHQRILFELDNSGIIQDASIFSDKCYAYALFEDGIISLEEIKIYEEAWEIYTTYIKYPNIVISLTGDPAMVLERIRSRKRPGEESVTLEYLNKLNKQRVNLFNDMADAGVRVYSFDWSDPNVYVPTIVKIIKQESMKCRSNWRLEA